MRTNFGAEDQAGFFAVMGGVVRPFLKTPAQGAQTSIYLASSPAVGGVSGQFFANRKPKTANRIAYDTEMAARLWQVSSELVGMSSDPVIPVGRVHHRA